MSEPFLGQISMVGFNFPPRGWAFCDGQLLPIAQNQSLFSILGTLYGGDGRTTFALPDLRGRVPVNAGQGPGLTDHSYGSKGGVESVTLQAAQMPTHSHMVDASNSPAQEDDPAANVWATSEDLDGYSTVADGVMHSTAVGSAGGGLAHNNMQPTLAIHFIIALQGLFPSRN